MKRLPTSLTKLLSSAALLLVATIGLGYAGCASLDDPGCASDADCRFGRTCIEGLCVGDPDTTISNNASENSSTNNDPNGATNNGSTNNGAPNNGSSNNGTPNGSTNNDETNNNTPTTCDADQDCPEGSSCDGEFCTAVCERSADCPSNRVCAGSRGCIPPQMCDLGENFEDGNICVAAWFCDNTGELLVFCQVNDGDAIFCECLDSATGQATTFTSDDLSCDEESVREYGNIFCEFGVPED